MATVLAGVEPHEIWGHFEALAAIPRASTKEAAAREHVLKLAAKLGLEAIVDGAGNVVVRKPAHAGRESAAVTALQGHLDMVCEKNEGTEFNFDTDGIRLVRKDDWLYADGTTLGSDNGVGVAAALAVMESKTIKHGPMEFVFTVEEETTLGGATAFKAGVLKARYLLNLDNARLRCRRQARARTTGSRSADSKAATPAWISTWGAAMRFASWAARCSLCWRRFPRKSRT